MTDGNVVFTGNSDAADLSSDVQTGSYFIWAANKGALRIGESMASDAMNAPQNIGQDSVGIGRHAIASGLGAVTISSPSKTMLPKATVVLVWLLEQTKPTHGKRRHFCRIEINQYQWSKHNNIKRNQLWIANCSRKCGGFKWFIGRG